jgi:hypothetical protein
MQMHTLSGGRLERLRGHHVAGDPSDAESTMIGEQVRVDSGKQLHQLVQGYWPRC